MFTKRKVFSILVGVALSVSISPKALNAQESDLYKVTTKNFNWPAPLAVDFGIVTFNHATYDLFSLNGVVACKDLLEEIPRCTRKG